MEQFPWTSISCILCNKPIFRQIRRLSHSDPDRSVADVSFLPLCPFFYARNTITWKVNAVAFRACWKEIAFLQQNVLWEEAEGERNFYVWTLCNSSGLIFFLFFSLTLTANQNVIACCHARSSLRYLLPLAKTSTVCVTFEEAHQFLCLWDPCPLHSRALFGNFSINVTLSERGTLLR